jgi:hypothetical protein
VESRERRGNGKRGHIRGSIGCMGNRRRRAEDMDRKKKG